MRVFKWLALVALVAVLSGCGYNKLQQTDEQTKAAWADVLSQYKRRADLVPQLVNTVKGGVQSEKDILDSVVEARAKATSIQATPELINDPQAFAKFQAAQSQFGSALSRLLAVTENYPQLKSIAGFDDLRAQIEGTENRITRARNVYIESVKDYNLVVRQFPSNLTAKMFGYSVKPTFTVDNEAAISEPPKIDFGASSSAGK